MDTLATIMTSRLAPLALAGLLALPAAGGAGEGETPAPVAERVAAARALVARERIGTYDGVYAFLREPAPDGFGGRGYDAMKDGVLIRLLALAEPPADLAAQLCAIVADAGAERVGRIYCAQYLGILYPRSVKAGDGVTSRLILATLRGALEDPCPWLAGTALLQLGELCRAHPEVDRVRVAEGALALASHEGAAARTSALQVGAALGDSRLLDAVREHISASSPPALRASAIRALGMLGDRTDLDTLRAMRDDPANRPYLPALRAAIGNMEERPGLNRNEGEKEHS